MGKLSKRQQRERKKRERDARRKASVGWTKFLPFAQLPANGDDPGAVAYRNSRYVVAVRSCPPYTVLSIVNLDHSARHDWRDFQRIKNELVGPEAEAVELYPRESRLIDTTNAYHLWARTDVSFDIGFDRGRHVEFSFESGLPQREPVCDRSFEKGQRVWVRYSRLTDGGRSIDLVLPATVVLHNDANCTCEDDGGARFTVPLPCVFETYDALKREINPTDERELQPLLDIVGEAG
jgi:hypothetical protein